MKINSVTQAPVQNIRDQETATDKAKETAVKAPVKTQEPPKVQGPTGNNLDVEA
ncbi:MAG TPA: hypothetical protein VN436_07080 [Holophaga sp.]|nr:hypothetical protein [Holophaga sp.]